MQKPSVVSPDQLGVNLGSTWVNLGQPGVNLRSTPGQLRVKLGSIWGQPEPPCQGGAEAAQLCEDLVAILLLPLEHPLQELLAPQVVACEALLARQLLLHDTLRGDAGVVRAGNRYVAAQVEIESTVRKRSMIFRLKRGVNLQPRVNLHRPTHSAS